MGSERQVDLIASLHKDLESCHSHGLGALGLNSCPGAQLCTAGMWQDLRKNQAPERCHYLWQAKACLPQTSVPGVQGYRRHSTMKVQGLIYQRICDLALPRVAGKGAALVQSPSGTLLLQVLFLLCQSQHTWKKTQVMATLLIPLLSCPKNSCPGKWLWAPFLCSPCLLLFDFLTPCLPSSAVTDSSFRK